MAQAPSISLSKFTASVQAAVKAAIAKHPKFQAEVPNAITVSYLIRGIPVSDAVLATVTLGETQAFANDIAAHVAREFPQAAAAAPAEGAIIAIGRHVVIGIPPAIQTIQVEK